MFTECIHDTHVARVVKSMVNLQSKLGATQEEKTETENEASSIKFYESMNIAILQF